MSSKRELKKFSDAVATIKSITRVYEQAAARRMRMVRVEMENVADYVEAAVATYSQAKQAVGTGLDEDIKSIVLTSSFRKAQKNLVLVLIASQLHYYGQLIPKLFKMFISEYKKTGADAIILGKVGGDLLNKEEIAAPNVTVFDFDDVNPDWQVVHRVSSLLGAYSKIMVFYGEYKSVFTQEVKSADLSSMVVVKSVGNLQNFLFRPKPGESLEFLEEQMISSGFLSKIYESQIAKYAARIKILEIGQVAEKISEAVEDLALGKRRFRKSLYNKKQQQLFTGSNLWEEYG